MFLRINAIFNAIKRKLGFSFTEDQKKISRYLVWIFVINLFIFNWGYISWFFSYNILADISSNYLAKINPENILPALKQDPFFFNIGEKAFTAVEAASVATTSLPDLSYLKKNNFLEIPKIKVFAPIIFTTSTVAKETRNVLKRGVLHYASSSFPGQAGTSIIMGHSAPPKWPKVNYDWIFNDLNQLEDGDSFFVTFNDQRYEYIVKEKFIVEKGHDLPDSSLANYESVLILLSCWPPGKDKQRIAIGGILKDEAK